ncbi:MAG: YggT family protein [Clostridiales bacterium]|nr:YggT family protein [Clostridiales bacterium]
MLARIIFSFITLGRDANPTLLKVRQFTFRATEPVLAPLRKIIKPVHIGGGSYLDLSPLIALILLNVLRGLFVRVFFWGF